jgi:hypothetical protein
MDLRNEQLKDTYGNLVTTGTTAEALQLVDYKMVKVHCLLRWGLVRIRPIDALSCMAVMHVALTNA